MPQFKSRLQPLYIFYVKLFYFTLIDHICFGNTSERVETWEWAVESGADWIQTAPSNWWRGACLANQKKKELFMNIHFFWFGTFPLLCWSVLLQFYQIWAEARLCLAVEFSCKFNQTFIQNVWGTTDFCSKWATYHCFEGFDRVRNLIYIFV